MVKRSSGKEIGVEKRQQNEKRNLGDLGATVSSQFPFSPIDLFATTPQLTYRRGKDNLTF